MELLKELCTLRAPSGSEYVMKDFLLTYIKESSSQWHVRPELIYGNGFQDNIILVFGEPRTAIFAHQDSIGFTVKYGKELVKIGSPVTESGFKLVGTDSKGEIECELIAKEKGLLEYKFEREIDRGTTLTFMPNFRETEESVQCCYMDNRLGIWNALQVAESLNDGIIVFSSWEEHGGGSVSYLGKYIYENYNVSQALISDITWVTEGVVAGQGCAVSMRDSGIPRRSYIERIIEISKKSGLAFQLEVESAGGSDGNELQRSPVPFDWCFVGAPESNVHSPNELVMKADIKSMVDIYKVLMAEL